MLDAEGYFFYYESGGGGGGGMGRSMGLETQSFQKKNIPAAGKPIKSPPATTTTGQEKAQHTQKEFTREKAAGRREQNQQETLNKFLLTASGLNDSWK